MQRKIVRNGRIYTPVDHGRPAAGKEQAELHCFEKGALIVENGVIADVGNEEDVVQRWDGREIGDEVDCGGRCVIPGFVDPHTHMCFARLRESEFSMRVGGVSYLDILEGGGGILSSVRSVAAVGVHELAEETEKHIRKALQFGTTTLEVKSGYGLDTENELKMLEAIDIAGKRTVADVVPTFLGAHAVPENYGSRGQDYIRMVIDEMIPAVMQQGIALQCDIFCEKGVFSLEQSRMLLRAAKKAGLGIKLHADEVNDLGGAGLAAELGALSADHLLAASERNIEAMARAAVVAVLLPATAYSLKKPYAKARMMIEKNVAVALATDCNPGSSFTESMQFVVGLAVLCMDLSPAEALTAATLNGAYAIGMEHQVGSLEKGKQADLLMLEGETPSILSYHAGVSSIARVMKKGELISTTD